MPCYTCLAQSCPTGLGCQRSTVGRPRTAHRLNSINTSTYKHPRAIMHSKQGLQIRIVHQQRQNNIKDL
jgi:hypothetical protein